MVVLLPMVMLAMMMLSTASVLAMLPMMMVGTWRVPVDSAVPMMPVMRDTMPMMSAGPDHLLLTMNGVMMNTSVMLSMVSTHVVSLL